MSDHGVGPQHSKFDQIGGWSRGRDGKGLCETGWRSGAAWRRDCAPVGVSAGIGNQRPPVVPTPPGQPSPFRARKSSRICAPLHNAPPQICRTLRLGDRRRTGSNVRWRPHAISGCVGAPSPRSTPRKLDRFRCRSGCGSRLHSAARGKLRRWGSSGDLLCGGAPTPAGLRVQDQLARGTVAGERRHQESRRTRTPDARSR